MTILYRECETNFAALKISLHISDGALYTHLEKLVQAAYVEKRREMYNNSPQSIYTLLPEGKKKYEEYLNFIESIIKEAENES